MTRTSAGGSEPGLTPVDSVEGEAAPIAFAEPHDAFSSMASYYLVPTTARNEPWMPRSAPSREFYSPDLEDES